MTEVKVNLFADSLDFIKTWTRKQVFSGGWKIRGVETKPDKVDAWLENHSSLGAAMENLHQHPLPRPRRVVVSKKLIVPEKFQKDVDTILRIATEGGSLKDYLGNNIHKLGASDSMLNFWGIFHFHLKPFEQRIPGDDNSLLFAYITDEVFCVIGLGCHEDLMRTGIIKTLQSEFPELLACYRVDEKAVVDIESEDYANMYRSKINAVVSINGLSYFCPGGGTMSNGNSAAAYFDTMVLRRRLDKASNDLKQWFLNGLEKLSNGYVKKIHYSIIHLKFAGFQNDEIIVCCPELGLTISYRDETHEMAIVGENPHDLLCSDKNHA